jgi:hypothetical protein
MKTIKDCQGRPWDIALTAASVNRIREGVIRNEKPIRVGDLDTLHDLITRLQNDFILLGEILFEVIRPQAASRNVTKDDFLDSIFGDTLDEMLAAFLDELIAFLPGSTRSLVAGARKEIEAQNAALVGLAIDQLNALPAVRQPMAASTAPTKRKRRSKTNAA